MAVPTVSIHTFAVPYHAAQFCRGHGILDDAHKGVPQLIQADRRVNAVAALVELPVVIEAVLILQQEDWIIPEEAAPLQRPAVAAERGVPQPPADAGPPCG